MGKAVDVIFRSGRERNKRRSPQAEALLKATAQELTAAQVLVGLFEQVHLAKHALEGGSSMRHGHTDSTQISPISPQTDRMW